MKRALKDFATSKWFDWFGVALVVGIAISAGYLGTRLDKFVNWGSWTSLVPFWFNLSNQHWYLYAIN